MSSKVLISIHPAYAEAIFSGLKRFEFRKRRFRKEVSSLVIYSTSPVSALVGTAEVIGIREGSPKTIWDECACAGAIDEDAFFQYFADTETAFAIELDCVRRFTNDVPLSSVYPGERPPQSFRYISTNEDIGQLQLILD